MTLTETKQRIRHAKTLMRDWRAWVNSHQWRNMPQEIRLPRADYDALEWGVAHLCKGWVYDEYDADGEPVRSTGRLVRIHGGYTRNDGTDNFLFKGIPVRPVA